MFLFQQTARTTHQLKLLKICGTDENIKRAKELVENLLAGNNDEVKIESTHEVNNGNDLEKDPENKPQTNPENNPGKESPKSETTNDPDSDRDKTSENPQNLSENAVSTDGVSTESNNSSGNDRIETDVATTCKTDGNSSEGAVRNKNETDTGTNDTTITTNTTNDNTTTISISTNTTATTTTTITNNKETIEEVILVAKASIGSVIGKGGQFIKKVSQKFIMHLKIRYTFF